MIKRIGILFLALSLVLIIAFSGCSDKNNDGNDSENDGNGSEIIDTAWADDVFTPLEKPNPEPAAFLALRGQSGLNAAPKYVRADTVITNDPDFLCDINYAGNLIKGIFIDSIPFKGKTPKAFAYYGVPANASPENPVPGVVLVHGGGNGQSANPWQVNEWVKRGYAAIAISMGNQVYYHNTGGTLKQTSSSIYPGPEHVGYQTSREEDPNDVTTHWMYHAVCKNILGKQFLASLSGVDGSKIGIVGGSWGGMITSMTIGLTDEFAFAVAVFGSGHQKDDPRGNFYAELNASNGLGARTWDASNFYYNIKTPVLFVIGDADYYFSAVPMSMSIKEIMNSSFLIKPGLPHDTRRFEALAEIPLFVKGVLNNKQGLPKVTKQPLPDSKSDVKIKISVPDEWFYSGAELYYVETAYEYHPVFSSPGVINPARLEGNGGPLVNQFKTAAKSAVTFEHATGRAIAQIPESAVGYYISFKFISEEMTSVTASTALVLFE
jgi:dienelactone hydrolase